MPVMAPTIHLNGTSRASLHRYYLEAYDATRKAYDAVAETSPNGRDYYPQGDDAIRKAADEHKARLQKLLAVIGELEELALHTMPQD